MQSFFNGSGKQRPRLRQEQATGTAGTAKKDDKHLSENGETATEGSADGKCANLGRQTPTHCTTTHWYQEMAIQQGKNPRQTVEQMD